MYDKILITGGNGFVGLNLFKYLIERGYNAWKFSSSAYDLRDLTAVKNLLNTIRPDCVIHLAALCGGIGANKNSPGKFMRTNLQIGLNTINTCLESGHIKKFINVGTICAYPKHCPVPFREEDLWNGYPEETNAPYGIAKKTLTELLIAYDDQYNFNSVNLYPTNMYGNHDSFDPNTSHVIPAIILKVHEAMNNGEDEIVLWGTGTVTRDFLYVKDFCRAIRLALDSEPGSLPINIGTGEEVLISELAHKICNLMGFEGKIRWDNSLPDGQPRRCVDSSRAATLLKYHPKTPLEEGLKKTINWYLNREF